MLGLIGKKLGMTRVFGEDGLPVDVTVINAGPCPVTQIKSEGKDGYTALQLGFGDVKEKNINKPLKGHLTKANTKPVRTIKEFRVDDVGSYQLGQEITVDIFEVGKKINVVGKTKGKGFQGTVKRWGFGGFPATHGSKTTHRIPGSIGASADPSRVWKNQKMPGHYGNVTRTVRNLTVVKIDTERNLLYIKGAVPGSVKGTVYVTPDS